MKKLLLIITISNIFYNTIYAQGALQKLKDKANTKLTDTKEKAKQKANTKIDTKIDNTLNKGVDAPENAVKKAKEKSKNTKTEKKAEPIIATQPEADEDTKPSNNTNNSDANTSMPTDARLYSKFDFVPADSTIFYDDLSAETTDEIPSKWRVYSGMVEVKQMGSNKVIQIPGNETNGNFTALAPRFKTAAAYLPYRFTAEFDMYFKYTESLIPGVVNIGFCTPDETGNFYSENCNNATLGNLKIPLELYDNGELNKIKFGGFTGQYSDVEKLKNNWVRVSIAVTEKSMKVYYNNERVLNAQMEQSKANAFAFSMQNLNDVYLKNIRIAAGGSDPYKQTTTTGKFIARGLKFETGKPTLKPESISELNRIVKLITDNPELKFEIGGHASKAGNATDANNLTLSQARAKTVMAKLISMGIAATKLTAVGYGDKYPVDSNATPEGKLNNQRVEFKTIK